MPADSRPNRYDARPNPYPVPVNGRSVPRTTAVSSGQDAFVLPSPTLRLLAPNVRRTPPRTRQHPSGIPSVEDRPGSSRRAREGTSSVTSPYRQPALPYPISTGSSTLSHHVPTAFETTRDAFSLPQPPSRPGPSVISTLPGPSASYPFELHNISRGEEISGAQISNAPTNPDNQSTPDRHSNSVAAVYLEDDDGKVDTRYGEAESEGETTDDYMDADDRGRGSVSTPTAEHELAEMGWGAPAARRPFNGLDAHFASASPIATARLAPVHAMPIPQLNAVAAQLSTGSDAVVESVEKGGVSEGSGIATVNGTTRTDSREAPNAMEARTDLTRSAQVNVASDLLVAPTEDIRSPDVHDAQELKTPTFHVAEAQTPIAHRNVGTQAAAIAISPSVIMDRDVILQTLDTLSVSILNMSKTIDLLARSLLVPS